VGLAGAGCVSGVLPTSQPSGPTLGAVLGPVTLRAGLAGTSSRVWIEREDGLRLAVIWPDERPVRLVGSTVVGLDGNVLARDGDIVWLGGGTLGEGHPLPSGCPVDGAFLLGELFHRNPLPS